MGKQLVSIKEILTVSLEICKKNISVFVQPIAIALVPTALLYALLYINVPQIVYILISVLTTVIAMWVSIVFVYIIDDLLSKKKINLSKIYSQSTSIFLSYFWVNILVAAAVILGFIALIIPGIILSVLYAFAAYVVLLEKKENKGIAALKKSYNLVVGRWWATFVRLIIPALIVAIIGYFLSVGLYSIINLGDINTLSITVATDSSFSAISDVIFLILTPLFTALSLVLYRSLLSVKK